MTPQLAPKNAAGDLPNSTLLLSGSWRVLRFLGRGELGEVYEVEDTQSKQVAAIKLFYHRYLPEAWRAFEQSARAAAQLPSQVCVRPLQFGYEPSVHCRYALGERVEQPTLQELIQTRGSLNPTLLTELLQRLASALEVAHASGLIHRNLKPTNVFFNVHTRAIKLSDFGTSALQCSTPTQPGWAMTPAWAAPEGLEVTKAAAPSMDVHTLGLLAFFALTGASYFRSARASSPDLAGLRRELREPLGSLELRARELGCGISSELAAWFVTSLAPKASDRFQSVLDQAEAFRSLDASVERIAVQPSLRSAQPPRKAPSRPSLPPALVLPEPVNTARGGATSLVPPPAFDVPERAVALATAQPIALMPSLAPPAPPPTRKPATLPPRAVFTQPEPPAVTANHVLDVPSIPTPHAIPSIWEGRIFFAMIGTGIVALLGIVAMVWLLADNRSLPPPQEATLVAPAVGLAEPKLKTPQAVEPAETVQSDAAIAVVSQAPVELEPPKSAEMDSSPVGVSFRCEPAGCDAVYCDGKALPVTDEPLILPPGKHTCKAMKSGFRSSSQTFVVAAGRSLERVFSQISNTNAPAKATRSKANVPGRKAFFAAP